MNLLTEQKDVSRTFSKNGFQNLCPKRYPFVKMISEKNPIKVLLKHNSCAGERIFKRSQVGKVTGNFKLENF